MRGAVVLGLLLALAAAAGCRTHTHAHRKHAEPAPAPYVRVTGDGSNTLQLQIALREFIPRRKGPVVWLCAVSHVGDTNYYAAVQRELDACTLVLFEGVAARAERPPAAESKAAREAGDAPEPRNQPIRPSNDDSLQAGIARALGLVFQLEAIDYSRRHFFNSDLSIEELRQVLAEAPNQTSGRTAGQSFESLMQIMQGGSLFNSLLQIGFRFIAISPKLQTMGRLFLIELLEETQGDPSRLGGLPPDMKELVAALVQRRDEKVVTDLAARLPELPRTASIGLFYGAGHMTDLQTRLCRDLGYRPARQIWLTAFGADLAKAGVSESERQWIESLIKGQLNTMPPSDSTTKE